MPQLRDAHDDDDAEPESKCAHDGLSDDEHLSHVDAVGDDAGPRHEDQHRAKLQRHGDPDGRGVMVGELGEHDPVLGGALHPRADVGREGTDEPNQIVVLS